MNRKKKKELQREGEKDVSNTSDDSRYKDFDLKSCLYT